MTPAGRVILALNGDDRSNVPTYSNAREQKSRTIARKLRDTADVCFSLKFANGHQ